jgi:UDP-glucose 4-epimerase
MSWLVTGGAGYIGSHIVNGLVKAGLQVVVIDDLSTGRHDRIPAGVPFIQGSLHDSHCLDEAFGHHITGVVHVAAKKRVDESLQEPSRYYYENVEALRLLLDRCVRVGVQNFLFSSSAAVYGAPLSTPVDEATPCVPTTPYGHSKLAGEWLTQAVGRASGMRTLALRYFNVAGAASPALGDTFAANLVPIVLDALSRGDSPHIYGDDYPTPDGTCIRDYVHVADVADAHVVAAKLLEAGTIPTGQTLNVGGGQGTSVRQIIDMAVAITGIDVKPVIEPRRAGDSPVVVAAVDRAAQQLGWSATRGLADMIESTWRARVAR